MYDTNGDGSISGKELDKCPGIKGAIEHYDIKHDGKITAAAIAVRIREWQETKLGTTATKVRVLLDGQPLEGATVTFEPEPFLGPHVATASGQTAKNGAALLTIATDPENSQSAQRIATIQSDQPLVNISSRRLPARRNGWPAVRGRLGRSRS